MCRDSRRIVTDKSVVLFGFALTLNGSTMSLREFVIASKRSWVKNYSHFILYSTIRATFSRLRLDFNLDNGSQCVSRPDQAWSDFTTLLWNVWLRLPAPFFCGLAIRKSFLVLRFVLISSPRAIPVWIWHWKINEKPFLLRGIRRRMEVEGEGEKAKARKCCAWAKITTTIRHRKKSMKNCVLVSRLLVVRAQALGWKGHGNGRIIDGAKKSEPESCVEQKEARKK